MRRLVPALLVAGALLAVPVALAKVFGPNDLRVCGRERCVRVVDGPLLRSLNAYHWGNGQVALVRRAPLGSPGFELRLRDGGAVGIVAGAKLLRFQSYGLVCGRFSRGRWYRFPDRAAFALRRLTARLEPVRVPPPPHSC